MRLSTLAAFGIAALLTGFGLPAQDAAAAQKSGKPAVSDVSSQRATPRKAKRRVASRPRITVRRRSYLDAGTDVLPGERKFMDYALPPNHSPLSVLGPGRGYDRQPLNGPWDVPGGSFSW